MQFWQRMLKKFIEIKLLFISIIALAYIYK